MSPLEPIPNSLHPIIQNDLTNILMADLPWEKLANKKIMITGGAGFLASYLTQSLLAVGRRYDLNIKIISVVRNLERAKKRFVPYLNALDFTIYQHDVSKPIPVQFPRADILVHSASQASPKYYGVDPVGTLSANSLGTMQLLDFSKNSKVDTFMFFSSGEIYGIPINSDKRIGELDYGYLDPMNLRSCYAESKRIGETMSVAWAKQYDIKTLIVRPFHTYGPGMALDDGRVFADFVADVVAKRDIILKSDGMALRPFCYLLDATLGFLTVLLKGTAAQAYNVGNPYAETSIKDLANTIANIFPERGIAVCFDKGVQQEGYLASPIARSCPDISKLKTLNWMPAIGIEDGFRRTIASFL